MRNSTERRLNVTMAQKTPVVAKRHAHSSSTGPQAPFLWREYCSAYCVKRVHNLPSGTVPSKRARTCVSERPLLRCPNLPFPWVPCFRFLPCSNYRRRADPCRRPTTLGSNRRIVNDKYLGRGRREPGPRCIYHCSSWSRPGTTNHHPSTRPVHRSHRYCIQTARPGKRPRYIA